MAALRSRCGHYIFLPCGFFLLSFFPRLISSVGDWMSTILPWCGLSANLGCMSETCCMRLAGNAGPKTANLRHLGTIAQLCRAISSQLRHVSTIGKKLVKQQCLPMCPQNMMYFGVLAVRSVGEFGSPQHISTGFASW